ncbi:hypothetical protein TcYC6_0117670 [Trypanosoma cruzi]|nr:hypothetical protein TcYC6_0117650 [Trypanosoma cruzi]KAF8292089.1 hypothetical protein TcYC6_0117670 [Trypanosoma cruzi]
MRRRRAHLGFVGVLRPVLSALLVLALLTFPFIVRALQMDPEPALPSQPMLSKVIALIAAQGNIHEDSPTVVVVSFPMTWRRDRLLHVLNATLYDWPRGESIVHEVLLVWNGMKEKMPDELLALNSRYDKRHRSACSGTGHAPFLRIVPQPSNSVANRWLVASLLRTESVLNIDDDMKVLYDAARCKFSIWLRSTYLLVATNVRAVVDCGKTMERSQCNRSFDYLARERLRGIGLSYNVALPRVLLSSRVYYVVFEELFYRAVNVPTYPSLTSFTSTRQDSIRLILEALLCDDISFNYAAANASVIFLVAALNVFHASTLDKGHPNSSRGCCEVISGV